jgi:microcystin-dependent protein
MSTSFASNSNLRGAQRGAALTTATSSFVGVVRVDATTLQVDANGTISVDFTSTNSSIAYLSSVAATKATSTSFGIVRADGTSVLITSGVISIQAFYTGMIMMWSGSIATIPSGWALCNGSNGTPDLRNRFIVGAGSTYNPADTGGTSDAIVVSHTHTATDSGHTHVLYGQNQAAADSHFVQNVFANSFNGTANANQTSQTGVASISVSTTGSSGTNQNLPPYYALAYIMKT